MFKAILFICSPLLGSTECLEIEDIRGPYDTQGQCIERVVEMYFSTQTIIPPPYESVKYKCESSL
jgi:hypothetical protein